MTPSPAGPRVTVLPAILLFAFLGLCMWNPDGIIASAQEKVFDLLQTFSSTETASGVREKTTSNDLKIVHVDIDAETTAHLGTWPWPRARLAALFETISSAQPRLISFAGLITGPDPAASASAGGTNKESQPSASTASPTNITSNTEAEISSELAPADIKLRDLVASAHIVGGIYFVKGSGGISLADPAPLETGDFNPADFAPAIGNVWTSYEPIHRAFTASGHLNFHLTESPLALTTRFLPLFIRFGDGLYPSLGLEILRELEDAQAFRVTGRHRKTDDYAFLRPEGFTSVQVGPHHIPTEPNGALRLSLVSSERIRTIAAWRLFENEPAYQEYRKALENAIVVVGISVAEDAKLSLPSDVLIPQGKALAQAVDQILMKSFIARPDWARGAELMFVNVIGITIILLTARFGAFAGGIVFFVFTAPAIYASWSMFSEKALLIDAVIPSLAIGIVYAVAAISAIIDMASRRRSLLSVMTGHLPQDKAEAIAGNPPRSLLGGARKDISFMLCGIRGFDHIQERFKEDPRGFSQLMHTYLSPLTEVIHERQGTVDKYFGSIVHAFWNAPDEDLQHAFHACETAQRIIVKLEKINTTLEDEASRHHQTFRPITVSIGISSGPALIGDMGSRQLISYTAVGEPVRMASVLYHASKFYGPAIIVSEATKERTDRNFAFLEVDYLADPEAGAPYRVYALLGDSITRASPRFKALEEAHEKIFKAMRARDWATARVEIDACRTLSGAIPTLYDLYESRVNHYEQNPPPEEWDGSHRLHPALS
jgi:adenylate cyclase